MRVNRMEDGRKEREERERKEEGAKALDGVSSLCSF